MRQVRKRVQDLRPGDIFIVGSERKISPDQKPDHPSTVYQVGPTHRTRRSEDYGFAPGYLMVTRHNSNLSTGYSFYKEGDEVEVWASCGDLVRDRSKARRMHINYLNWQLLAADYMAELGRYVVFMGGLIKSCKEHNLPILHPQAGLLAPSFECAA